MDKVAVDETSSASHLVAEYQYIHNATDLESDLIWLAEVIDERFHSYLKEQKCSAQIRNNTPPSHDDSTSPYATFISKHNLTFPDRLLLILALVCYIRPQLLDIFYTQNTLFERRFRQFGGMVEQGEFTPTFETLLFLIAGDDLGLRFQIENHFSQQHLFQRLQLLESDKNDAHRGLLKKPLRLAEPYLKLFTLGHWDGPSYGSEFPAQRIETQMEWQDLVLHSSTAKQVEEIQMWIDHGKTLMHDWGMAAKLRPGYRSLFYGPPGTGKTLTACLLAKSTGRDVYKIDLSLVVSKYIGETERNLSKVFDAAENNDWILFFDEADALFGKRSETKNAHDRYANQEVSYLLQRIETFDGIVILASNFRDNIDTAFLRRFESTVYFPMPQQQQRAKLWRNAFPSPKRIGADIDIDQLATDHEISGGSIANIIRYASLQAITRGRENIVQADLNLGLRHEMAKNKLA